MATISRRKLAEYTAERLMNGDNATQVLEEVAAYLIDARRVRETQLVVRAVEDALLQRGVALTTVTSARPLSEDAKHDVQRFIRREYPSVGNVILREIIDEGVLAGIKIRLPDAQLDATAKAKLEKLVAI
ncbi:F0F1 ATP synthase subunit delta [Candidatus Saccharibacteria bacterium]|jgi:F0F1-type ATP synthase delta subunit|nr:F0F1 ATP synthase subunit delta [Candidatus Saccharibacteria bacterium]